MTNESRAAFASHWHTVRTPKQAKRELQRHPSQPQVYICDSANRHWVTWQRAWQASRKVALEDAMVACDQVMFPANKDTGFVYISAHIEGAVACRNKIKELLK